MKINDKCNEIVHEGNRVCYIRTILRIKSLETPLDSFTRLKKRQSACNPSPDKIGVPITLQTPINPNHLTISNPA